LFHLNLLVKSLLLYL